MSGIDLDHDGIDDVAVWIGTNQQYSGGADQNFDESVKIIFVNVQGRWLFLEEDIDDPICGQ